MAKYLFSVDLDDTLLKSDKSISKESIEYIRWLVDNGHYFVINTGRPHQSAIEYLRLLDIKMPIIVNNGGAIVYYDDEFDRVDNAILCGMDTEIFKNFIKDVRKYIYTSFSTGLNDGYSHDLSLLPWWTLHEGKYETFHEEEYQDTLNEIIYKSEFRMTKSNYLLFMNVLTSEKYSNYFEYLDWSDYDQENSCVEVSLKGVNKGATMMKLAENLGIEKDNVIAFGDQMNDYDMLKTAGLGVCMRNSNPKLIELIKEKTDYDQNHNGVTAYIKKILKIRGEKYE